MLGGVPPSCIISHSVWEGFILYASNTSQTFWTANDPTYQSFVLTGGPSTLGEVCAGACAALISCQGFVLNGTTSCVGLWSLGPPSLRPSEEGLAGGTSLSLSLYIKPTAVFASVNTSFSPSLCGAYCIECIATASSLVCVSCSAGSKALLINGICVECILGTFNLPPIGASNTSTSYCVDAFLSSSAGTLIIPASPSQLSLPGSMIALIQGPANQSVSYGGNFSGSQLIFVNSST